MYKEKTMIKLKHGEIICVEDLRFNEANEYVLFDANNNFIMKSCNFNTCMKKLNSICDNSCRVGNYLQNHNKIYILFVFNPQKTYKSCIKYFALLIDRS